MNKVQTRWVEVKPHKPEPASRSGVESTRERVTVSLVLAYLQAHPMQSIGEICQGMNGMTDSVSSALKELIRQGKIGYRIGDSKLRTREVRKYYAGVVL